jgi:hypothetical protein
MHCEMPLGNLIYPAAFLCLLSLSVGRHPALLVMRSECTQATPNNFSRCLR